MSETVTISGHVADLSSGLAVAGVQVEAWDADGPGHQVLGSAATDAGGGFSLRFERPIGEAMRALPPLPLRGDVDLGEPAEPMLPRLPREEPIAPVPSTEPLAPAESDQPAEPIAPRPPLDELPEPPLPRPQQELPVYLKVLRNGETLAAGTESRWDGRSEVLLSVDATETRVPPPPPRGRPGPTVPPAQSALTIAELGEALAATAASIQQELAHYPTEKGSFLLDDLDVEIPVGFGVDTLGQLRVRVADEEENASAGRLRLRVKPLLEPPAARSVTAPQPLESLGALSPEVIGRLEHERVYSVGDLLRVSRNTAGVRALEALGVQDPSAVRDRAEVVALPSVPPVIAESLVGAGIHNPQEFVNADPAELAERLEAQLGRPLAKDDVVAWQQSTRPLVGLDRLVRAVHEG